MIPPRALILFAAWLAVFSPARGQTGPGQVDINGLKKSAPRVYIDCQECDLEYIKTEITFVNYVRDRKEAQVHILITTQTTGSGGREYTLSFLGQNDFQEINDTVKSFSNKTDTADEIRKGLVQSLKLGLASYAARTPIAARISVSYAEPPPSQNVKDRWNNWIFSLSSEGFLNGESSTSRSSWGVNFSANRITAETKLRLGLSGDFSRDRFDYGGGSLGTTYDYFFSVGLSYSFGSIFSKVVNPRFGSGSGMSISVKM